MTLIVEFLQTLNNLHPLAIIALLALVIYRQAAQQRHHTHVFNELRTNDLHSLPDILAALQRIEIALARIETKLKAHD